MGGAVGDCNNDGWPDLYVTCYGPNVLYRNNGDGTFTDVTEEAGVMDSRWSAGAAFGDYDGDGWVDLFVTNYVDFRLDDLPGFGSAPTCQYRGLDVQCGPRGLRGAGDSLYRNNGDGTFADVSEASGVHDPNGYYGLGVVWTDFDDDGRLDVYVANDATPNFLYRNEGDGRAVPIGLGQVDFVGPALIPLGHETTHLGWDNLRWILRLGGTPQAGFGEQVGQQWGRVSNPGEVYVKITEGSTVEFAARNPSAAAILASGVLVGYHWPRVQSVAELD